MGGWQKISLIGREALRRRSVQAGLSVAGHVLVLGGLLLANPWRLRPVPHEPPLVVDLVTLAPEETRDEAGAGAPVALPPPAPPPPRPPAKKPAPAPEPDATPEPEPEGVTMELPDVPDSSAAAPAEDAAPSEVDIPGGGLPAISPAAGQAIAALICRRMSEDERYVAGCSEQPRTDPFERPPAIALLTPEERRIQAVRTRQLARAAGYDNFLEWYLEHDAPIPSTMPGGIQGGIDNSIFIDRKDEGTMQQELILRGGTPDWADDIAKAHGRD